MPLSAVTIAPESSISSASAAYQGSGLNSGSGGPWTMSWLPPNGAPAMPGLRRHQPREVEAGPDQLVLGRPEVEPPQRAERAAALGPVQRRSRSRRPMSARQTNSIRRGSLARASASQASSTGRARAAARRSSPTSRRRRRRGAATRAPSRLSQMRSIAAVAHRVEDVPGRLHGVTRTYGRAGIMTHEIEHAREHADGRRARGLRDRPGERDVLRADLDAVLRVAAVDDPALRPSARRGARSRSSLPVGCELKSTTCAIAAAPMNALLSFTWGHASRQQPHVMHCERW